MKSVNKIINLGIFDKNGEEINDQDFLRGFKKGPPPFQDQEYVVEGKVSYLNGCYYLGNYPLYMFEKFQILDFLKSEEKSKLPQSFDAWDWAEEFCEIVQKNPTIPHDKETMMGWFANAIMAGWDEMGRRKAKEDENRWIYVLTNSQTGETVALYSEEPTKEKCDKDYSLHLGQDLEWSVRNVLYTAGQDSAWNCNLHRMKVDSLNRMKEVVEIKSLKQYEQQY